MPRVPFKLNQDRRHHIPRQKRRVTNWREYDAGLRQRGIVQPRRWVVERSLGWFGRWRRLSKDYEALPEVSEAMVPRPAIRLMLHRLAHPNRRRLPAP